MAFSGVTWRTILLPPEVLAASEVTSSVNSFATDLYQVARSETGNLVISPLSVAMVMALTYLGSGGPTAEQLRNTLHLPPDPQQVADGYKEITSSLQVERTKSGNAVISPSGAEIVLALILVGERWQTAEQMCNAHLWSDSQQVGDGCRQIMRILQSNEGDGVLLRLANRMYLQTGFGVKDSFRQKAVGSFRTGVEELDFADDSEGARVAINDWVAQNTEGKTTDLFQEGTMSPDTVLVLVNALYFSASWTNVFEESFTEISPFYVTSTRTVHVPIMKGKFQTGYGEVPELDATAVRLSYESKNIPSAMIILLPNKMDGLENLENNLAAFDASYIQFYEKEVSVYLPKFKIQTTKQMSEELQKLNVINVFGLDANLTGISDGNLSVSQIIQKTQIEVNENGTEALSATGVAREKFSMAPPEEFKADHPFLFLLMAQDIIILMGRVAEPTE